MKSPCNNVCQMDPQSGLCIGCARTLDEITRWAEMTDTERDRVMAELPMRNSGTEPEPRRAAKRR
ncbi:MAG TPA: DUF1289 domain-containing protein [Burkholderiales bacterium]|jgi:uncharacterized protein|nr:DUF1289 domain-containing protein [Burkholderiales bacterium]